MAQRQRILAALADVPAPAGRSWASLLRVADSFFDTTTLERAEAPRPV